MNAASKGLGKGLSALMGDDYGMDHGPGDAASSIEATPSEDAVTMLGVDNLQPGKYQPRKFFDEAQLQELSDSIKAHGIMQPILVRPNAEDGSGSEGYEIIAGERRWRAAKMASLASVPVLIRRLEESKRLEFALIENVQRQDLNVIEEGEGYQSLIDTFGYTQENLSAIVGKSRSHIANCLRMLNLPEAVSQHVRHGDISAGHARALLKAENPAEAAKVVIDNELNVRQTEHYVKTGDWRIDKAPEPRPVSAATATALPEQVDSGDNATVSGTTLPSETRPEREPANDTTPKIGSQSAAPDVPSSQSENKKQAATPAKVEKSTDIIALEEALMDHLSMPVEINDYDEQGHITIHYESLGQLDDILKRLGGTL